MQKELPRGAKIFVAMVFTFLYLTFLVLPYMLWREFGVTDGLGIALFHSYLFVFYPIFGLAALVAFFRPAVIFTDFYWHHVKPLGRIRFLFGFVVVLGFAALFTLTLLRGQPRAVWELASRAPALATGISTGCQSDGTNCNAGPLLSPMFAVRAASRKRIGLGPFARSCNPDKLLELPEENIKPRQCFVSNPPRRLSAAECCSAQRLFEQKLHANYIDWEQVQLGAWDRVTDIDLNRRSNTGNWHAATLYFKTFFILIMIAIALLLVVWQKRIDEYYDESLVGKMDRGMIVGAVVMLFWPLMEYAYGQSAGVMLGSWETGFKIKSSIVVLPWALVVGLYFLRRHGAGVFSQLMSVAGVIFAAFQHDQVTNLAVRFVGSGAGWLEGLGMIGLAILALVVVLWPAKTNLDTSVTTDAAGRNKPGSGIGTGGGAVTGGEPKATIAPAATAARAPSPGAVNQGNATPAKPAPAVASPAAAAPPRATAPVGAKPAVAPRTSVPSSATPKPATARPTERPDTPAKPDPLKGPFRS